jgi:hypothetical protein
MRSVLSNPLHKARNANARRIRAGALLLVGIDLASDDPKRATDDNARRPDAQSPRDQGPNRKARKTSGVTVPVTPMPTARPRIRSSFALRPDNCIQACGSGLRLAVLSSRCTLPLTSCTSLRKCFTSERISPTIKYNVAEPFKLPDSCCVFIAHDPAPAGISVLELTPPRGGYRFAMEKERWK